MQVNALNTGVVTGSPVRIGFAGYGYWGPKLVRNFAHTEGCAVAAICDNDCERLRSASCCHPAARLTTNYDDLLEDRSVDAIVIATPVRFHFKFAMAALQRGKHVLVEKPMARSVNEASQLAEEATRRNLVLMVDHTFLFTPAVRKLREMITEGMLGDLRYFDSIRANQGLIREDVNVFWDVAVHDLTILQYILKEKPAALSAVGVKAIQGNRESIGYLTLFFNSGMIAHITASWLSPRKIRQIVIGGSQRTACYDDSEPIEKVKLYDTSAVSGVTASHCGDMWVPHIEKTEALRLLAQHFRDCIDGAALPLCDGDSGSRIVELLVAVDRSVAEGGSRVKV